MQIVALNWQKCDAGTMINTAMFAGSKGWILKPPSMRDYDGISEGRNLAVARNITLSIEFIAIVNLTLPFTEEEEGKYKDNNIYVNCYLHSVRSEKLDTEATQIKVSKLKTKTVKGINSYFDGEKLEFPKALSIIPELSFTR